VGVDHCSDPVRPFIMAGGFESGPADQGSCAVAGVHECCVCMPVTLTELDVRVHMHVQAAATVFMSFALS
jgi:hypothetical protein